MTKVWKHADVAGGTLLVLLAMADWADDDGTGVYPRQKVLAVKARLQERQVRNCLDELEERGYIERTGKRGSIIEWKVNPNPENIAVRQPIAGDSGNPVPTEPSTTTPEGEANASPSKVREIGKAYVEVQTPGSAAAPWLVLELARLMRRNDPVVKLPVGLRELMSDEYRQSLASGEWATPAKRRELILPVLDKPALVKWLDEMRLLVDSDQRDSREVAEVLRWCQADPFWKGNILSAAKFRKQYAALRARWQEEGGVSRPGDRQPSTRSQLDAITGQHTTSLWRQNGVCPWALRAGKYVIECERSHGHDGTHTGQDVNGTRANWPEISPNAFNREEA